MWEITLDSRNITLMSPKGMPPRAKGLLIATVLKGSATSKDQHNGDQAWATGS